MSNKKRGKPAQKNEQRLKEYLNGKQEDNGTYRFNDTRVDGCPGNCGCGGCGNLKDNRS